MYKPNLDVMIYKSLFIYFCCFCLFWACDTDVQNDDQLFNDLQAYIESVEDTVNQGATVSWQEIETEYQNIRRKTQQSLASSDRDANEEYQRHLQALEQRYQDSRRTYETGNTERFDQHNKITDTIFNSQNQAPSNSDDTINRFP